MTQEQITALACEYAEETHHGNTVAVDEAISTIRFLLRRFCLVEKSKIKETWKVITNVYLAHRHITYDGARYLFDEVLFPEIGKEVER